MGLPSYTGGCQYSFDQQVDRQNIVVKIDSDDDPKNMKSDLHSLKCAIGCTRCPNSFSILTHI